MLNSGDTGRGCDIIPFNFKCLYKSENNHLISRAIDKQAFLLHTCCNIDQNIAEILEIVCPQLDFSNVLVPPLRIDEFFLLSAYLVKSGSRFLHPIPAH